jgi:hypothetical protein
MHKYRRRKPWSARDIVIFEIFRIDEGSRRLGRHREYQNRYGNKTTGSY